MPSMPVGSSSASAIESSERTGWAGSLNATFILLTPLGIVVFIVPTNSVAQRYRRAAQQRCRADIRQNPVIADHDRRRQDVAQVPADAEFAVVAIAGQAAGLHRAHDGRHREF